MALSCNALVPELAEGRRRVAHAGEVSILMLPGAFRADSAGISLESVAPRNVQVTRRAYKLLAVLIKSNSEAEVS